MKHIASIDDLVDFLGGDTAVAAAFGISQSAVAQWKLREQIAAGWHLRLLAEVRRRGATIDPGVFGLSDEEAVGLFEVDARRARPKRPPRSAAHA